jgi:nucleoside-diphosphate-sugar epimerase
MQINILGLGWYGEPLAEKLLSLNHEVLGSTRTVEKQNQFLKKNIRAHLLQMPDVPEVIEGDIIVLNIPPIAQQLTWFQSLPFKKDQWMIFISSTSEAKILVEEEEWVKSHFTKWTILRFGGLFGGERHPGVFLSGKKNLKGRMWTVNLIHRDDTVDATIAVIEKNIFLKTINVVSSEHPTREEYYSHYCRTHQLPLPEFDPDDSTTGKIVPNDELLSFYLPKKKL